MEILSIDKAQAEGGLLMDGQGIALTRNVERLDALTRHGVVIDGFCLVYIESGQASLSIGGKMLRLTSGEMLVINAGHPVTEIMMSVGLSLRALFVSYEMMDTLANKLRLSWTLRSRARDTSHFLLQIDEEEGRNICHYYDLLESNRKTTPHQRQTIDALCEAFGFDLLDVMERHSQIEERSLDARRQNTSGDYHFDRFMRLLVQTHPLQRQVSWYADQLNISAKYLSMICQKVAHTKPSTLIEQELTQQAVALLKESSMSVKEISQELGFCNQSHFGTYMRRATGKGPNELRS